MVELRNGAMFEIAWCNLMKLNYDVSLEIFTTLLVNFPSALHTKFIVSSSKFFQN